MTIINLQRFQNLALKWIKSDIIVRRLGRGVAWTTIGAVTSSVFGVASSMIIARLLGASEFGQIGILRSTIDTLSFLSGFSLGFTANRYIALHRTQNAAFTEQLIWITTSVIWFTSSIASLALFLCASEIASLLKLESSIFQIKLTSVILFFTTVCGTYSEILSGFEDFRAKGIISTFTAIISLPMIVVGVIFSGLSGALIAIGSISSISLTFFILAVKRTTHRLGLVPQCKWDPTFIKILGTFTLPAFLSGVLITPIWWLGNLILIGTPNGYHEMGIFCAANNWRQAILFIPNILGAVSLPMLSNLFGNNKTIEYLQVLKSNLVIVLLLTAIPSLILVLCAPCILGMYGSEFRSGTSTMNWLLGSGILYSLAGILGQILASVGRMWIGLSIYVVWALAFLISARYLTPLYGSAGLAMSYALSYGIQLIFSTAISVNLFCKTTEAS